MKPKHAVKIIICDDDAVTRQVLARLLQEQGYSVTAEAGDANTAISMCRSTFPDIIFLAIYMPGMDGLEALELIRREVPSTAIVLISGASTVDNVRRAIRLGVNTFLVKPFSADKLAAALAKALR